MEKLKSIVTDKKFLVAAGILLLTVLAIMFSGNKPSTQNLNVQNPDSFTPFDISPSPVNNEQALKEAIAAQMKADNDYEKFQDAKVSENPWHDELPLYGEKYFVYYDLQKNVFVGNLYTNVGDNVNEIKTEVARQLREDLDVPSNRIRFEWAIIPQ